MIAPCLRTLLISCFFFLASCQSQHLFDKNDAAITTVQVADVFVNDQYRGTTPQTIRIYRGRRELSVTLKQGRKTIRAFEVEETYSPNAGELDFSFYGTDEAGTLRFTVEELPTKDDLLFVIPFYQQLFTVEDNQYGLTLIIDD